MTAEYSPFARPTFTADDFARNDATGRFDDAPARPRAPVEEPRSFMSDRVGADPVMEAELAREDEMLLDRPMQASDTTVFAAAPIYAGATRTRSGSTDRKIPMAALIAVPAVVLMAGVGYIALSTGGAEQGVAQKAPGATEMAAAPAAPAFSEPTALAAAPPPVATPMAPVPEAVSTPRASERVDRAPTRVARARPAPAPAAAASAAGVDASATLPEAPIPYSGAAQTGAPVGAAMAPPPIIVPPPVAAEPVNPTAPVVTPAAPSTPESTVPETVTPPTL